MEGALRARVPSRSGAETIGLRIGDDVRHNTFGEGVILGLTGEGEKEFQLLLRQAWWKVQAPAEPLIPALSMMWTMPRAELVSARGARASQLESERAALAYQRGQIKDGATGADGQIRQKVTIPAGVRVTAPGFQGSALKGGPHVRWSVPA